VKSESNEATQAKVTEAFEQIVGDYDTTQIDKKLEKSRAVFNEVHTVPVNCEVGKISTRAEVKFNK
jgi:hypothetical protein